MAFGQLANHGIGGFWELGYHRRLLPCFSHLHWSDHDGVFFEIGDEEKDIRS